MVFFILQKQNTTRAPYCQRGIRNGQRPLWWSAQCHCHSFKLMFGLPHTHRHTQALKLKGLSLNHLLNETQKRRCAVKHPGEEPKRACEASSNRLELTSVIENVCFLQPGVEERCLRFFFIYIYCMYIKFFIVSLKNKKKGYQSKNPWSWDEHLNVLQSGGERSPGPTLYSGAHGTIRRDSSEFSNWGRSRAK